MRIDDGPERLQTCCRGHGRTSGDWEGVGKVGGRHVVVRICAAGAGVGRVDARMTRSGASGPDGRSDLGQMRPVRRGRMLARVEDVCDDRQSEPG